MSKTLNYRIGTIIGTSRVYYDTKPPINVSKEMDVRTESSVEVSKSLSYRIGSTVGTSS